MAINESEQKGLDINCKKTKCKLTCKLDISQDMSYELEKHIPKFNLSGNCYHRWCKKRHKNLKDSEI